MAEDNFSELGRTEALTRLFEGTPFKPFSDGSFITAGKERIFSANRLFLEGIDFNLVYFPLKHLGYKCVTAVSADIYAKVAEPRTLAVTLGISARFDYGHIKELWDGMVTAAQEHGYRDVALDLAPSRNGLSIALAANGAVPLETDKRRIAAKSMDLICISNNVGGAFLGFKVLENAEKSFEQTGQQPELDKWKKMVGAYLKPEVDCDVVKKLKESEIIPSYGYVVDHGLADAVKKLVRDSGFGAKVYVDKLPFESGSFELGKE
ncbi:MAG: hypothetical protein HUJ94_04460, partial [Bacteroidales bacterium]|nr:hypothetical protein [Bacteroidales bacterium]